MIQHWFTVPIYARVTENFENIQDEIRSCYDKVNFQKHQNWGNQNHSLSDPNFNQNLIADYNLKELEKEIKHQVKNYTNCFSDTEFDIKIEDCWITNTSPKEHTVVHNHGTSDISGVYYFKTNKKDGNIYFLNPNTSLMNSIFLLPDDYVEYPPQQGLIILFPGWLMHGVRSNDTDENRISVSFNVKLRKKI